MAADVVVEETVVVADVVVEETVVVEDREDEPGLESEEIGALPLIEPLIEWLRLREFLERGFGRPDARLKLRHVDSALLLVRNFVLSRHPLYGALSGRAALIRRSCGSATQSWR